MILPFVVLPILLVVSQCKSVVETRREDLNHYNTEKEANLEPKSDSREEVEIETDEFNHYITHLDRMLDDYEAKPESFDDNLLNTFKMLLNSGLLRIIYMVPGNANTEKTSSSN